MKNPGNKPLKTTRFFRDNNIIILLAVTGIIVVNIITLLQSRYYLVLDNSIRTEVTYIDGTTKNYNSNTFPAINKGEAVVATIPIPYNSVLKNPAICFHIYNCTFELKYKDKILFESGADLKNRNAFIGNHFGRVILPQEVLGEEITLTCVATENSATGQLTDVFIMEAMDANKYPLMGHEAIFIVFLPVFVISLFVLIYALLHGISNRINRMVIWVSLLGFIFSLYVLSSGGLLNVLFFKDCICANIEYLSIFALPIPISLYFLEITRGMRLKKLMCGMSIFYILYFVVTGFLNYTTKSIHYNLFLTPLHIFMLLGIIVYLTVPNLKISGEKDYGRSNYLKTGFFALLVVCLFDLARFQLNNIMPVVVYKNTLIPYGILVMIVFMVRTVYQEYSSNLSELKRKDYIESLAYRDALSGLMSRARFNEVIASIRKDRIKEYTVIFMDLNGLKFINDTYGHDEGDMFIRAFSNILEKNFSNADIISRYGGDEFIVVYTKNLTNRISEILEGFTNDMDYINKERRYRFLMSASFGYAISTQDNPYEIDDAIKLADEKMYEDKRIYKERIRSSRELNEKSI